MDEGLIARRYARALYRYALEEKVAEEVYEAMKAFDANAYSHPDLHRALGNPMLAPEKKERLIVAAIGREPGEALLKFIRLLITNHRETYMRLISFVYQKIYREANGIVKVNILTAEELPAEAMERIKAFVKRQTSKAIEFVHNVDSSILGGFILQVGSRQLDASLRKELKDIGLKLLGQGY